MKECAEHLVFVGDRPTQLRKLFRGTWAKSIDIYTRVFILWCLLKA